MAITAAEILAIAGEPEGDDHFRRHLLFMHYTLRLPLIDCFHMANAERQIPLDVPTAEYIAAHWRDEDKGN